MKRYRHASLRKSKRDDIFQTIKSNGVNDKKLKMNDVLV